MSRTELAAPIRRRPSLLARVGHRLLLGFHRLLERLDLVPPEFGDDSPIDTGDARAVMAEWKRYLRLWAGYNPEELFALKVGGVILLTAVVAFWMAIALML